MCKPAGNSIFKGLLHMSKEAIELSTKQLLSQLASKEAANICSAGLHQAQLIFRLQ